MLNRSKSSHLRSSSHVFSLNPIINKQNFGRFKVESVCHMRLIFFSVLFTLSSVTKLINNIKKETIHWLPAVLELPQQMEFVFFLSTWTKTSPSCRPCWLCCFEANMDENSFKIKRLQTNFIFWGSSRTATNGQMVSIHFYIFPFLLKKKERK